MRNTLTIALLGVLTKSERTRLGKYLKSPFFNNRSHLHTLFLQLRKVNNWNAFNAETCYAKIFPGKVFTNKHWNTLLSELNTCIEEFLVIQQLLGNPILYGQALLDAYAEKMEETSIQRAARQLLNQIPGADGAPENAENWRLRFYSKKCALTHPSTNQLLVQEADINQLESDLDTYYFINKMQLHCNRLSGSSLLKWNGQRALVPHWLEHMDSTNLPPSSPLFQSYRALLRLLTSQDSDFLTFMSVLEQNGEKLHPEECRKIFRLASNYCAQMHRKGETRAFNWHINLYNWSVKHSIWSVPKEEALFLNLGILLAKDNRQEDFRRLLNSEMLVSNPERHRQAQLLLKGYWHFHRGDFSTSMKILKNVVVARQPRYTLLKHSVFSRSAYMCWRTDQLDGEKVEAALKNFEDFLNRNTIFSTSLVSSYKNLIWFIRQLINTDPNRLVSKRQLREALETRSPAVREWVESILNQLPDRIKT